MSDCIQVFISMARLRASEDTLLKQELAQLGHAGAVARRDGEGVREGVHAAQLRAQLLQRRQLFLAKPIHLYAHQAAW